MKKYIYFHVCCINHWRDVVDDILGRIVDSGLYDKIEEIRCCVLGDRAHWADSVFSHGKMRVIYRSDDISLREFKTLHLLHEDSGSEDFYVLYLHSKGVSKPYSAQIQDWIDYMLYFNVNLHELAIRNLQYNDACGVNYQGNHYSGNFWWSKSAYIRKLDRLSSAAQENYVAPETWLTSLGLRNRPQQSCKVVSLWRSGVNHYQNRYPDAHYKNCLKRYDTRVKRLLNGFNYVLINNHKCGFSSSNLLESQRVIRISADDTVILFYRNVFFRAISTFINWTITDARYKSGEGWLLKNMREFLSDADYEQFIGWLSRGNHHRAFVFYADVLESEYEKSNHTLPQIGLLEYYGIEKVDCFIELENNTEFQKITGIEFPYDRTNESDPDVKASLLDLLVASETLQGKFRNLYRKDIEFFKDRGLSVDDI